MIDKQPHEAISRHPYTYKPTQQKNYIICAKLRGDTAPFLSLPPSLCSDYIHRACVPLGRKEGRKGEISIRRPRPSIVQSRPLRAVTFPRNVNFHPRYTTVPNSDNWDLSPWIAI